MTAMKTMLATVSALAILCQTSHGINRGLPQHQAEDYPWNNQARHPLDAPVKAMYPNGSFFLNLGPTGLRARIDEDAPTHLRIMFVFQDNQSPARGKVEIGDVLVGANGRRFTTPHIFGRRGHRKGWDGPLMELSRHIEDSQGRDGALELTLWPGGEQRRQKTVTLQLKPVGRFSATYPYDCPRSEAMLEELCDFIASEHRRQGGFGRPHVTAHCLLALMASGIRKHERLVRDVVSGYASRRYRPDAGGFVTWNWGFDGIVMGEYYLLHRDRRLIPAIESLQQCWEDGSLGYNNGVFTHRSNITIRRDGARPYAEIAGISGLAMTAMTLFRTAGLPYSESAYQAIHQRYLESVTPTSAAIAYNFGSPRAPERYAPRHAIIRLRDPKLGLSGKGPGYEVPNGMRGLGAYTIEWPTQADPRWQPTDWVAAEAEWNRVVELTDGLRQVDRNHPRGRVETPVPTRPYNTTGEAMHPLPTGLGALAHLIGNPDNKAWEYLGRHCADTCALSFEHSFSGHGGGQLHGFWNILGASRGDPQKFRVFLDYMKSFLILSETHNGGMIVQPWNRDRPGGNGDPFYGPRLLPTATAAILLSLPRRRLQITGADLGAPAESRPAQRRSLLEGRPDPVPQVRPARTLSAERRALLDRSLRNALVALNAQGELKPVPLNLSFTQARVWLKRMTQDGTLTLQAVDGERTVDVPWDSLRDADLATLAMLIGTLKPESTDAQALVGMYMELLGRVQEADRRFERAGPESTRKLAQLFETG